MQFTDGLRRRLDIASVVPVPNQLEAISGRLHAQRIRHLHFQGASSLSVVPVPCFCLQPLPEFRHAIADSSRGELMQGLDSCEYITGLILLRW